MSELRKQIEKKALNYWDATKEMAKDFHPENDAPFWVIKRQDKKDWIRVSDVLGLLADYMCIPKNH